MSGRIVFDLDGTLIDSAPDIRGIANAVLEEAGAAPITLAETRSFIGEGIQTFVAKMRAARGIPESAQAEMLRKVIDRYDDAVTLTVTYPGVPETLETLSRRHRLGICTNKLHRPCMAVLRHLRLDRHFGAVVGGDNPLGRKPDPAPLLLAFDELGSGPRLYVGDSEIDAATAERAGIRFLLFTEGYRKTPVDRIRHDAIFDDFVRLPDLVEDFLGQSCD